jgi:hypothetical protein
MEGEVHRMISYHGNVEFHFNYNYGKLYIKSLYSFK